MAKLKALKDGGFSLALGFGDERKQFRVSTKDGEVFIPDHLVAQFKEKVDFVISEGLASFVDDDSRQGPRVIKVDASELVSSPTPVPLELDGEPLQKVVTAYLVQSTDDLHHLNEGASADYDVVDREVFWVGADETAHKYAVFFVE